MYHIIIITGIIVIMIVVSRCLYPCVYYYIRVSIIVPTRTNTEITVWAAKTDGRPNVVNPTARVTTIFIRCLLHCTTFEYEIIFEVIAVTFRLQN